jgi:hypothetical protein
MSASLHRERNAQHGHGWILRYTSAIAAAGLLALALHHPAPARAGAARRAALFACSGQHSTTLPCYFSTPSGNIRCQWTPSPNSVACELLATKRAYRLRPNGKAKAIRVTLHRRGETLPTDQQLVFPQSLSCHDTNTTMTCDQDFGLGFFKLARHGSRSA